VVGIGKISQWYLQMRSEKLEMRNEERGLEAQRVSKHATISNNDIFHF